MKLITLGICLLFFSSTVLAGSLNEQKYVRLKLVYLQDEVRHMKEVVGILSENDTSQAAQYETRLKQSKRTFDELLARNGLSLKEYFEYEQANKEKLASLLAQDKKIATEIRVLEAELTNLRQQNVGVIHIVREQD